MKKEIPDQIQKSLQRWRKQSAILQCLFVILGGLSIIAPLVVTSFTDYLGGMLTRIVSFCGAFAIGLIASIRAFPASIRIVSPVVRSRSVNFIRSRRYNFI